MWLPHHAEEWSRCVHPLPRIRHGVHIVGFPTALQPIRIVCREKETHDPQTQETYQRIDTLVVGVTEVQSHTLTRQRRDVIRDFAFLPRTVFCKLSGEIRYSASSQYGNVLAHSDGNRPRSRLIVTE